MSNDARGPDPLARSVGDAAVVRQVFDEMPLMVVALDGPELRFSAVTGAYRRFWGRSRIIGVPIREVFPETLGQQIIEIFDRVYATGESFSLREFRLQVNRPDRGDKVELFIDFNASPLHGPDGEVTGVVIDVTDVTARVREKQAERQRLVEVEQRYAQARDVIQALQRELLPTGVPVFPQLQVAGSYVPAEANTAAGGDWFDAVALPDGRVALIVGDVVGHGVTASATMGQLRVLLSERLLATGDIRTALADIDRMARRIRGGRAATVCVAVLDPATGALTYCTAGHPPPLLLPRDGEARFLSPAGPGPLGVRRDGLGRRAPGDGDSGHGDDGHDSGHDGHDSGHDGHDDDSGHDDDDFVVGTDRLEVGDMLLLYTDGILERPGRTIPQSTVELAQAVTSIAAGRALPSQVSTAVERVCDQALEMLLRVTGHADDITLLAAQRVAPAPPFAVEVPADLAALADIRRRLAGWLIGIAAPERDAVALQHAITELATNSIEHAYLDSAEPNTVVVRAALEATGRVRAEVRDRGRWREPKPSPDRGLGLVMIGELVDSLRIRHDDAGTTAVVTLGLSRPARLLTAAELASGIAVRQSAPDDPFLIIDQPAAVSPRMRVDGPVDARTAPVMSNALRMASAAGARDLTVDLTGVTHLASAGVAALHRLARDSAVNGGRLRLLAPAGTPADLVLTLVDLPHAACDQDACDQDASNQDASNQDGTATPAGLSSPAGRGQGGRA